MLFFIICVTLPACSRRDTPTTSPPDASAQEATTPRGAGGGLPPSASPASLRLPAELSEREKAARMQIKEDLLGDAEIIIGGKNITEQLRRERTSESTDALIQAALDQIVASIPSGKDKAICLACLHHLHQGMSDYVIEYVLQPKFFPAATYAIKHHPTAQGKDIVEVDQAWDTVTLTYDYLIGSSSEDVERIAQPLNREAAQKRTVRVHAVFQIRKGQPAGEGRVNSELPLYLIPEESKLSNPLGWDMAKIKARINKPAASPQEQATADSSDAEEAAASPKVQAKTVSSDADVVSSSKEPAKTVSSKKRKGAVLGIKNAWRKRRGSPKPAPNKSTLPAAGAAAARGEVPATPASSAPIGASSGATMQKEAGNRLPSPATETLDSDRNSHASSPLPLTPQVSTESPAPDFQARTTTPQSEAGDESSRSNSYPASLGSQEELSAEVQHERKQITGDLKRGEKIIIGGKNITDKLNGNEDNEFLLNKALNRIVNSIPPGKDQAAYLSCLHQGMGAHVIQNFLHEYFSPEKYHCVNNTEAPSTHTIDQAWETVTFERNFFIFGCAECEERDKKEILAGKAKERTVHVRAVFQIEGIQPDGAVWVNADRKDEVPLYLIPEESKLSNPLGLTMEQIRETIEWEFVPARPTMPTLQAEEPIMPDALTKPVVSSGLSVKPTVEEVEMVPVTSQQRPAEFLALRSCLNAREQKALNALKAEIGGGYTIVIGDENASTTQQLQSITVQLQQATDEKIRKDLRETMLALLLASMPNIEKENRLQIQNNQNGVDLATNIPHIVRDYPEYAWDLETHLSCLQQRCMSSYVIEHILQKQFPKSKCSINKKYSPCIKVDQAWKTVTFEADYLIDSSETVHVQAVFTIGEGSKGALTCVNIKEGEQRRVLLNKRRMPLFLIKDSVTSSCC